MSYVVLARRLRPSRFDDLIGQETAAQTLRNAVLADRVAHAFLFSGSRGVGKTSAARILTRALNCLNPDNGDPCNSCENCVEINQNASPDVYEIDAASNRGIDNIRELRENVNYVPARCRYKVYIIDEAHMLTLESFNALLKTLEEPPSYVKFIFATTEPHKIPQTIISRCQRYDFLRIPIKTMADFLETVVRNEKLELSRKAIEMIARNSVGGMRDALTAIDQILSFSGTSASDQKVAQILGILDSESRFAFTEALLKKNEGEALRYFQQLQEHGHDAHDILADLLKTIKTTALVRTLGTSPALFQDISADDLEVFAAIGKAVSADELQQIFHILLELEEQMKRSAHTKICFEMAILKIASIEPLVGLPEIISGIQSIRSGETPAAKTPETATFVKAAPEESTLPARDNSVEKHQHSLADDSGVTKQLADVSVIKNILQSGTKETHKVADNPTTALNSELETPVTQVKEHEQSSFTQQNEVNPSVAETSVYPEKTIPNEDVSQQGFSQMPETQQIQETQQVQETSETWETSTQTQETQQIQQALETAENQQSSPQTEEAEVKIVENERADVQHDNSQSPEKPAQEWTEFAAEVQKRSSKLASFVRNTVPQSLSGTQLKLAFKSGNYPSMFTEQNRSLLEEIATDWCGHAVHVSCEITPTVTSMRTIVEHEQILLEQAKEIKRENAREFPKVKDILSVFTNSKISAIEFSDA
ncbi:MAG: DNA polymerase III subunit gamma/tau [Deltaproteobacteria bacterium]|jgi:DNA polymerase-3 subunit gamma/tau|nr:DNA polymerase III subunit gamma/tau [Deltaproteobacteria bacterium]